MHDAIVLSGELEVFDVRVGPGCSFLRLDRPLDAATLDSLSRIGEARLVGRYRNKVTDLGRSLMRALAGNGASAPTVSNGTQSYGATTIADLAISSMQFGALASPTAAAASDFELEDSPVLHTDSAPTVTYPTNFTLRWEGLIPANTYTGEQVTEEGLFAVNGALFARTTFAPSAIVIGFGKQFRHTFSLAAS